MSGGGRKLFGTDGVRGAVGSFLTAELATSLGRAVATWAEPQRPQVLIVRDTRESGPMLESALAAVRQDTSGSRGPESPRAGGPSVPPSPPPAPKAESRSASGAGPARLHWNAGNDGSIYGYVVYRADDRAGPYVRISPGIIHARRDAAADHRYEFEDAAVEKGKTYYYYVDTIDKHSRRERFVPVLEKTVQ